MLYPFCNAQQASGTLNERQDVSVCKEYWKRKKAKTQSKFDFSKFNFDIKTETYFLITNEKYKSERTASKLFLQHSVPCNALFNCFHCSGQNPTGFSGGQVHLSGLL